MAANPYRPNGPNRKQRRAARRAGPDNPGPAEPILSPDPEPVEPVEEPLPTLDDLRSRLRIQDGGLTALVEQAVGSAGLRVEQQQQWTDKLSRAARGKLGRSIGPQAQWAGELGRVAAGEVQSRLAVDQERLANMPQGDLFSFKVKDAMRQGEEYAARQTLAGPQPSSPKAPGPDGCWFGWLQQGGQIFVYRTNYADMRLSGMVPPETPHGPYSVGQAVLDSIHAATGLYFWPGPGAANFGPNFDPVASYSHACRDEVIVIGTLTGAPYKWPPTLPPTTPPDDCGLYWRLIPPCQIWVSAAYAAYVAGYPGTFHGPFSTGIDVLADVTKIYGPPLLLPANHAIYSAQIPGTTPCYKGQEAPVTTFMLASPCGVTPPPPPKPPTTPPTLPPTTPPWPPVSCPPPVVLVKCPDCNCTFTPPPTSPPVGPPPTASEPPITLYSDGSWTRKLSLVAAPGLKASSDFVLSQSGGDWASEQAEEISPWHVGTKGYVGADV